MELLLYFHLDRSFGNRAQVAKLILQVPLTSPSPPNPRPHTVPDILLAWNFAVLLSLDGGTIWVLLPSGIMW